MTSAESPSAVVAPLPAAAVLLSQGAEARVYACSFAGRPAIVKERFVKRYRHAVLDCKLNALRVAAEARTLARARRVGLAVPAVYLVEKGALRLWLERIDGSTLKTLLDAHGPSPWALSAAAELGRILARMHTCDLVHGDLTTSNVLVRASASTTTAAAAASSSSSSSEGAEVPRLVLIDFGLASQSTLAEDKAVDLYVLERAFLSTHPRLGAVLAAVYAAYDASAPHTTRATLERLELVRQRGRKKLAFG